MPRPPPPAEPPAAPAPAAPAPAPRPFLLPLELTVRQVRTTERHVELDCLVADAEGRSVQFLPLSVDVQTGVAEIEAILLATIQQTAATLYRHDRAKLLPPVSMQDAPALRELVGRSYKGSVTR